MTGVRLWVAGARPRTLGAAIAPVVVGTAAAHHDVGATSWGRAALALVVALGMQVGVNYANDYSDGMRGTDRARLGPVRLTATGLATPRAVATAAGLALLVAAAAGLALAALVSWWLVAVGAAAIVAALGYTGGPKPYGYHGLGEVMVLAFFGFVATAGSAFVQLERVPGTAWWGSLTVGLLATAILVANNVRDLDTDAATGKRTLAVRLGAARTRALYVACIVGAFLAVIPAALDAPWALLALLAIPLAVVPARVVLLARDAPALVGALVATARLEVLVGVLLAVGLWLSV
ncbi:MAG TPA: 1,4-dihydroxy-2-naphthoate polyprenyltransferase [Acidimicrobiia bacterium]|nr:1,4-dihydroxy-2-naphthoate polyprenyltransferase [Acidimicrobiia bacterium]